MTRAISGSAAIVSLYYCTFSVAHEPVIKISTTKLSVGKRYAVSPVLVWDMITDTTQWPLWGPTVKRVASSERFIYKGATGQVLTAFNVWLPFIVVECEPGRFWSWKVASVNATGHRVQPVGPQACDLWFEVPVIAAPYGLICQLALTRIERLLSETRD